MNDFTAEDSRNLHSKDDVDFDRGSHHHTIGDGIGQAASGQEFRNLAGAGFQLATLVGNWNNLGGTHTSAQTSGLIGAKSGRIWLEGSIQKNTANYASYTTIFNLPGYAPSTIRYYSTAVMDNTGLLSQSAVIQVNPDGTVKCINAINNGYILFLTGSVAI